MKSPTLSQTISKDGTKMNFVDVEINQQFFDFYINENHPVVAKALGYMTEAELRSTLVNAMIAGGLHYGNLEEMNAGGSWCIASKAASVDA